MTVLRSPLYSPIYNPIYSPLVGNRASSTPDLALFAKYGQPGFLFNFARTDRTFQEATGQTLADDAGEAVALALDEAQWGGKTLAQLVAGQPNLKGTETLGSFTGANPTVDGGGYIIRRTADGTTTNNYVTIARTGWYLVEFTVEADALETGNNFLLRDGAASANVTTGGPGTYSVLYRFTQDIRWMGNGNGNSYRLTINSVKSIPGYHGIQSGSTGARPTRQAGGVLRFDAVDDNLLTTLAGGASGNTIIVRMAVPGTIASTQVVAGFSAASNGRFQLAVDTSGQICAGVGANSTTGHVIATDRRGQTGVVALVEDGTNVKLYWNGVEGNSAARNGAPETATPYRIGGNNGNGTAGAFFGGSIYQALAIQAAITPAEALSLSNYWNSL